MKVRQSQETLMENRHDFVVRDASLAVLIFKVSERKVFQNQPRRRVFNRSKKLNDVLLVVVSRKLLVRIK